MGQYSEDPEWADVTPLPQDDGGPNPLAQISYTDGYSEAMSYLRAVMATNEMSERVLKLTGDIIDLNAAHYTVWLYRARALLHLHSPLRTELTWLNEIALTHLKNYQIWHHRQFLLDNIDSPAGEIRFINTMLAHDAKNYHVWSYRQWLVRRFGLWDVESEIEPLGDDENAEASSQAEGRRRKATELQETERLLREDVRNNSAWNHRFFLVNGNEAAAGVKDDKIRAREVRFAQEAIRRAPQNQSPWNYLRGTVERAGVGLQELRGFCEEFADLEDEKKVRSSHALDLLAEIHGLERRRDQAAKAYDLLAAKFDPIRANYWIYLKSQLPEPAGATAAA